MIDFDDLDNARACAESDSYYFEEKIAELQTRLEITEALLLEIFRNMKPRDCLTDWYDRAREYLDGRTK